MDFYFNGYLLLSKVKIVLYINKKRRLFIGLDKLLKDAITDFSYFYVTLYKFSEVYARNKNSHNDMQRLNLIEQLRNTKTMKKGD